MAPHPDLASRHLHHKLDDWQFESEVRFISPHALRTTNVIGAGLAAHQLKRTDLAYPPDCIKRIYFGTRCSPENIDLIKNIINNNRFLNPELILQRVEQAHIKPYNIYSY